MKSHSILLVAATFAGLLCFFTACKNDDEEPSPAQVTISDFTKTIAENPTVGTSLGNLSATTNQGTLIYSLSNQNPTGALAVDSLTGELTVANASLFDFETNQTLTATSTASVGTVSQPSTVTITLTDVDESVDAVSVADFALTLDENPISGQLLGQVATTSASGTVSFALASQTPAGAMAINSSTGELSVADSIQFDYETNPTLSAQVVATVGTASDTAQVTIILNDVDESTVTADDLAVTINENPSNGQSLGKINTTNASGAVTFSFAAQNPAGTFALNDSTGELTVADSAKFDFETNPTLTAQIIATVGTATDTAQVTITLNDVDETMITATNFSVTMDENPTNGQVLGTVQASSPMTLSFSLTSQTPAGAMAINATTGELTVAQASAFDYETNQTLTANFEVTNGPNTETGTITITLNDVNEAAADAFILTYRTSMPNEDVTIYTYFNSYTYDYNVDWGDGTVELNQTGNATHTYTNAGDHQISITGDFPAFRAGNPTDARKLISVDQWGNQIWQTMQSALLNCSNLESMGADAPDLSQVTSMVNMFGGAEKFNIDIGHWDVSNVEDMNFLFSNASIFNQDLSSWDVANVISMSNMFVGAAAFNQDIGSWDVSNVTDMGGMFNSAISFNQNIGNWNVGNVTNMSFMFRDTQAFNQDIGSWDVSNVTDMQSMFSEADFNRDIGSWNVGNVTDMSAMFSEAGAFNQDISGWDISKVVSFQNMFRGASLFNRDISSWNTSSAVSMFGMFNRASSFNQPIGSWNVSGVTDMSFMFDGAANFNQNINSWDVSNVTNMLQMFRNTDDYNQPLNNWGNKLTNVTNMGGMFFSATRFNQNINSWDVSNVTNMSSMFSGAVDFNQPLINWTVSNVTNMELMFSDANSFNGDITSWNVSSVTNMYAMFVRASAFNRDISGWAVQNVTSCQFFRLNSALAPVNTPNFTNCTQ
ncbi:BspA family leucine-rich repeat surface protein [Tunicatimonas pelagia]|uniref:BspA family leucine-rich repeat surface protein n=1 Tax=Tunicatimonas pelagia TaxID=931531 RepID=UPI002666118F|nr:BspA family leucine-rich repeat surface protein [Tunicatimonas pelagia]WKN43122.1 BspA family leucine-rich repeat surface protein [Tunicatimonas pelagia]